ncbi:MAG: hypothetical protein JXR76_10955 [Deltaproteobacteria bacterium]|nr:hypothetical protein [Deltaproteobacteria bacterium]
MSNLPKLIVNATMGSMEYGYRREILAYCIALIVSALLLPGCETVDITYRLDADNRFTDTDQSIIVDTDDRIEPVDFNSTPGQIFISPPEVVFNVVNHGDADEPGATYEITLENTGVYPLEIYSLSFSKNENCAFRILSTSMEKGVIENGYPQKIVIQFIARDTGDYHGELLVSSSSFRNTRLKVPVCGRIAKGDKTESDLRICNMDETTSTNQCDEDGAIQFGTIDLQDTEAPLVDISGTYRYSILESANQKMVYDATFFLEMIGSSFQGTIEGTPVNPSEEPLDGYIWGHIAGNRMYGTCVLSFGDWKDIYRASITYEPNMEAFSATFLGTKPSLNAPGEITYTGKRIPVEDTDCVDAQ